MQYYLEGYTASDSSTVVRTISASAERHDCYKNTFADDKNGGPGSTTKYTPSRHGTLPAASCPHSREVGEK